MLYQIRWTNTYIVANVNLGSNDSICDAVNADFQLKAQWKTNYSFAILLYSKFFTNELSYSNNNEKNSNNNNDSHIFTEVMSKDPKHTRLLSILLISCVFLMFLQNASSQLCFFFFFCFFFFW